MILFKFYELFKINNSYFSYFFKTGNVLSENNIFNVNNIELTKKPNISNNDLADQAINKRI